MKWLARIFRRPARLLTSERTPENLDVMAEAFVRCGGVLDLATFNALEPEDRLAILRAADRVAAARAVQLSIAVRSGRGGAEVLASHDGGLAARTLDAVALVAGATVPEEA